MATISATAPVSALARPAAGTQRAAAAFSSPVIGLPRMGARGGRARCSAEKGSSSSSAAAKGAAVMAAASSAVAAASPALALVDERMTTEGTGLSLGISNNLLTWILLGVFGLVWALFFVYTSTLEEDEDSALSL